MKAKGSAEAASLNRWDEIFYPFREVNILSNLDALARLNFRPETGPGPVGAGVARSSPECGGLLGAEAGQDLVDDRLWATLAVLRVLKRFGLIFP